jgi:cob(I)alamin adenosyltransferase
MSSFCDGEIKVWQTPHRQTPIEIFSSALRSAGVGNQVLLAQFLRGGIDQGPNRPRILVQNLQWLRPAIGRIINSETLDSEHKAVRELWLHIVATRGNFDLLVLDEIGFAVELGLLTELELVNFLKEKPQHQEIQLCGQRIPESIKEIASQWTEIRPAASFTRIAA